MVFTDMREELKKSSGQDWHMRHGELEKLSGHDLAWGAEEVVRTRFAWCAWGVEEIVRTHYSSLEARGRLINWLHEEFK